MAGPDIDSLLIQTESLMRTMYVVREDFALAPKKDHIATCINFNDLQSMRDNFVNELRDLILQFVYSPERIESIHKDLVASKKDKWAACSAVLARAHSKFRASSVRGQFGELLLSVLLQHHFRAVPVLRKMPITTGPEVERHGMDAVHIAHVDGKYRVYLGEAKAYSAERRALRSALENAVTDIVQQHYPNHRRELDLYIHEDFMPASLEPIVQDYIRGTLDAEVHLVGLIAYDAKIDLSLLKTRQARLDAFVDDVRQSVKGFAESKVVQGIEPALLPRMNYVFFPVHELDKLIEAFGSCIMRAP